MTDNEIEKSTAKYWCLFDDRKLEQAFTSMKKAAADSQVKAIEKKAQHCMAAADEDEQLVSEGGFWQFLKDFWNAPPAWAEEPTGFNDPRPEKVFKDVESGLEGYHRGENIGAVTGLAMVGAAAAAEAPAAAATAATALKTAGKAIGKAAVGTAKVAGKAAASHPVATAVGLEIADQELNDGKVTKWTWGKFRDSYEKDHPGSTKLLDGVEKTSQFLYDNKVPLLAAAGITYALYKTKDLWSRYVQRFAQWATSGKCIAKAEFEADGSTWTCEFSTSSKKWQLAEGKKAAKKEDLRSFAKTAFAKKFAEKCAEKWEKCIKMAGSMGFESKKLVEFLCSQCEVPESSAKLMAEMLSKDSSKLLSSMREVRI